ncbi:hypothetical protein JRO89_XS15G0131400 [Xanthoceras sorbifolium]|uniref:F-box domain-containing protein n=1 Tax=Xanthoceras sorbifolium TaxID=99658 RepID=A0ABQ8H205_9ROSI|nr:hypothetical protein JRO89_XS15G0131400 [Xanthoceras sorbifolium]
MEKSSSVEQSTRKWENLHVDIISKIFNGVPFSDLCDNLPFQWKSSVRRIDIPDGVNISDEHLLYVAERTVGLKDLFIWNCSTVTGEGFAKAMCNWKNVKCLYLQKENDSRRVIKMQESSSSTSSRRWEDLNPDILNKIFENIPFSHLSSKVSLVCYSWQLSCWHTICWRRRKVLDLSFINGALETIDTTTEKGYDYKNIKLMNLLVSIMQKNDGYGLSIQNFFIPRDLEISDKHLVYIAERFSRVENLAYLKEEMSNSLKMQKSSSVGQSKTRNWENMHVDVLQKIFNGVPFSDLCNNVPLVCHSWRLGCWHTISPLYAPGGVDESKKVMRLLKSIIWKGSDAYESSLEQWKTSISRIDILDHDGVEISDEHLLYVAERTVGVKNLFLWNCSLMTGEGFTRAMYNWKNVKPLYLKKVRYQYALQCIEEFSKKESRFRMLRVSTVHLGLTHHVGRAIVQHIVKEAKMMEFAHSFESENAFIVVLTSKSSRENPCLSLDDDEPSKIPNSLESSLSFDIKLCS